MGRIIHDDDDDDDEAPFFYLDAINQINPRREILGMDKALLIDFLLVSFFLQWRSTSLSDVMCAHMDYV